VFLFYSSPLIPPTFLTLKDPIAQLRQRHTTVCGDEKRKVELAPQLGRDRGHDRWKSSFSVPVMPRVSACGLEQRLQC